METTIRNLAAEREQRRERWRELAEMMAQDALDPTSHAYRHNGPDRLLKAAQVYATLACG